MIKKTIFLSCTLLSCVQAAQQAIKTYQRIDTTDTLVAMMHALTLRGDINENERRLLNNLNSRLDTIEKKLREAFNSKFDTTPTEISSEHEKVVKKEIKDLNSAHAKYVQYLLKRNEKVNALLRENEIEPLFSPEDEGLREIRMTFLKEYLNSVNRKTSTEPA